MTIKTQKALSMAEVVELVGEGERAETIKSFIRKFTKRTPAKAKELKAELEGLDLLQLKEEHIVKLIDFKPIDVEDFNKVVLGLSLSQDEINKILEIIKKY